jgi:DNA processing protein
MSAPSLRRPSDLAREGAVAARRGRRISHSEEQERSDAGPCWPSEFLSTGKDRDALLVLLHLSSLTARRLLELAGRYPTASACLDAVRSGEAGSDGDRRRASRLSVKETTERLRAVDARLVAVGESEYPSQLLDLFDPPAGLFIRGRALAELEPRVAVVGARNCSPSGGEMASMLGGALGQAGVCVVSGAARGIDACAHEGALRSGGASVAVLGSGIDTMYPKKNRTLIEAIERAGAVVSEYPPGTPAEPFRFPARNRIVAALCRAVVVVEGTADSGSLITAEHALDLGREVFAVPGAPSTALAQAPLSLIRDGAGLIRGPQDLLDDIGIDSVAQNLAATEGTEAPAPSASLSSTDAAVWAALTSPSTPDRLAHVTGLALPTVLAAMIGLEMRRLVVQVGGRYERRAQAKGR